VPGSQPPEPIPAMLRTSVEHKCHDRIEKRIDHEPEIPRLICEQRRIARQGAGTRHPSSSARHPTSCVLPEMPLLDSDDRAHRPSPLNRSELQSRKVQQRPTIAPGTERSVLVHAKAQVGKLLMNNPHAKAKPRTVIPSDRYARANCPPRALLTVNDPGRKVLRKTHGRTRPIGVNVLVLRPSAGGDYTYHPGQRDANCQHSQNS